MTPQERQQKLETLRAVGALAPLVTALYDANETVALNTVTNSIREALAPLLSVSLEDDGAIKPGLFTGSVGAGKSYTNGKKESDMDVVITLNGQRATGKTVLANKIINTLREQGFDVVAQDTDGTVDILRVLDPTKDFRGAPAAGGTAAEAVNCKCPRCRIDRGEAISKEEKAAIELWERVLAKLSGVQVFTIGD